MNVSPSSVEVVGIVGAGVIGASWSALFLAAGKEVDVFDPSPTVEADTRAPRTRACPPRRWVRDRTRQRPCRRRGTARSSLPRSGRLRRCRPPPPKRVKRSYRSLPRLLVSVHLETPSMVFLDTKPENAVSRFLHSSTAFAVEKCRCIHAPDASARFWTGTR